MQTEMTAQELLEGINKIDNYYYPVICSSESEDKLYVDKEMRENYIKLARRFLNTNGYLIHDNQIVDIYPQKDMARIVVANKSDNMGKPECYDNATWFVVKKNQSLKQIYIPQNCEFEKAIELLNQV